MNPPLLQNRTALDNLRQRLEKSPAVLRYGAEEAATMLHAFSDIESSARRFLLEQLPKLANPEISGEALDDLLFEIREEFRHMLYHMHDPEFFRLIEPTHDWLTLTSDVKRSDNTV